MSFHKYSAESREEKLLELLREGKNVALVSDAGTPIISDPGDKMCIRDRLLWIDCPYRTGGSAEKRKIQRQKRMAL